MAIAFRMKLLVNFRTDATKMWHKFEIDNEYNKTPFLRNFSKKNQNFRSTVSMMKVLSLISK